MRKKMLLIPLALLLAVSLVACAAPAPTPTALAPATVTAPAPAPAKAEYEWRFASPWTQQGRNESLQLFVDLMNVYSDGRIQAEFYPNGLLGSHDEIFRAVQEGSVEGGVYAPYVTLVPGGMLNWMPWTVGNYDEAAIVYDAPDGILYQVMDVAWEEVGFKLLWSSHFGPYGVGNKVRPLITPDDMKDNKMRVSASTGSVMAFQNMGEGTGLTLETIPWADIYNALERGVVEQIWSLWPSLIEERHAEVLTYYTALDWAWDAVNITMNRELWDSLPLDIQEVIKRAGANAEMRDFEFYRRANVTFKQTVVDWGLEIYYPTSAERAIWREKANMPAIWDELCRPWLDEHYPGQNMGQQILDELDRVRGVVEAAGG